MFWAIFANKFGKCDTYKYINLAPRNIPSISLCESAGRILLHGFLLIGYLPININPCVLFKVLTFMDPSDEFALDTFLKSFVSTEEEFLRSLLRLEFDFSMVSKIKLMNILASFHLAAAPSSPERLKGDLIQLGRHSLIILPYFMLHHMYIRHDFTSKICEDVFVKYFHIISPRGEDIAKALQGNYSSDTNVYGLEGKVFGYLEKYVSSLNQCEAQVNWKLLSTHLNLHRS